MSNTFGKIGWIDMTVADADGAASGATAALHQP